MTQKFKNMDFSNQKISQIQLLHVANTPILCLLNSQINSIVLFNLTNDQILQIKTFSKPLTSIKCAGPSSLNLLYVLVNFTRKIISSISVGSPKYLRKHPNGSIPVLIPMNFLLRYIYFKNG